MLTKDSKNDFFNRGFLHENIYKSHFFSHSWKKKALVLVYVLYCLSIIIRYTYDCDDKKYLHMKNKNTKEKNSASPKQKVLLPTLREQQRYLVYKVIFSSNSLNSLGVPNISFDKIHNDILLQCNNLLGVFDGGLAGIMSAKFNPEKLSGIIRVNNKYVDKLKVCLGMIKNSNGKNITVDSVYVSGMLNKAIDKMDNTNNKI